MYIIQPVEITNILILFLDIVFARGVISIRLQTLISVLNLVEINIFLHFRRYSCSIMQLWSTYPNKLDAKFGNANNFSAVSLHKTCNRSHLLHSKLVYYRMNHTKMKRYTAKYEKNIVYMF